MYNPSIPFSENHMIRRFKQFSLSIIVLLFCNIFNSSTAYSQDKTMLQGFYWDVTPGGVWYDSLAIKAPGLSSIGIDAVWFPPPAKGDGQLNVGYTPYDYYDLGEFDSQSGDVSSGTGSFIATRYGTREKLEAAIEAYQSRGIEVYADIVLNHRSGGLIEPNIYGEFYTNRDGGSLYSPDGENTFTAFPLTNGSGRIAWTAGNGNEYFYPNAAVNPDNTFDFFSDSQLAGFHQMYTNSFGYSNALHDGNGSTLAIGDSLKVWGDWLSSEIGFDGYRMDFVKGIHPNYLTEWLNHGSTNGRFHVHELYDGSMDRLKTYLNQMSGTARSAAVFDFNLRFGYKELSDQGDGYDIRWLLGRGLFYDGVNNDQIVNFVDSHDFDRLDYQNEVNQDGHSPITNLKLPLYAHMMSLPPMATIWYRDLFWYGLTDQLSRLSQIRDQFISGAYHTNTSFIDASGTYQAPFWPGDANDDPRQMMVIQREGIDSETGAIMAINKHSSREIGVWVSNVKNEWNGQLLYDISGNVTGTTQVYEDGRVYITAKPGSYSAWVPLTYTINDEVSLLLTEIGQPAESVFTGQSFAPSAKILNGGLFTVPGATLAYDITLNGTSVASDSRAYDAPAASSQFVTFDSITLSASGTYTIEFTLSYLDGDVEKNETISRSFTVTDPSSQTDLTIDGFLNESNWVLMAERSNENAGFGTEQVVEALYVYADADSLYLGLKSKLIDNDGNGIGLMLEFSELSGLSAGEVVGNTDGAVHYLNAFRDGDPAVDFAMDLNPDLGISLSYEGSATDRRLVMSMARYMPDGNEGLVVVPFESSPVGNGDVGIGPIFEDSFLPQNSVTYAFSQDENFETGLELAISKDALGIYNGEVRAFAFIVSGTAYFSNSSVPGEAGGTGAGYDGAGNPGFATDFSTMDGGPFYSDWVALTDFEIGTPPVNDVQQSYGAGWNMVSLPTGLPHSDVSEIFPQALEGTLYNFAGSYTLQDTLVQGEGYWLNLTEEAEVTFGGSATGSLTVPISQDWNLLGSISESAVIQDPDDLLIEGTLYGYNGAYSLATAIEPGLGYWVAANTSGEITLVPDAGAMTSEASASTRTNKYSHRMNENEQPGNPGAQTDAGLLDGNRARNGAEALQLLRENLDAFVRVTIGDGMEHTQTLYFGGTVPDGVAPLSMTLPPVPPAGSFDARLQQNRWVTGDRYAEIRWMLPEAAAGYRMQITSEESMLVRFKDASGMVTSEMQLSEGDVVMIPAGSVSASVEPVVSAETPASFYLMPNYPNPFNPTTQIRYGLAAETDVLLEVYNMIGQRVAVITNESQQAGHYTVTMDGRALSSGIYLYRLQAGDFVETRKMTLVK